MQSISVQYVCSMYFKYTDRAGNHRDLFRKCHSVDSTVRNKGGKARWLSKVTSSASRIINGGLKQSGGTNISGISITALKTLPQAPRQPHLQTRKSQHCFPILLELPHALPIQIYDLIFLLYATLFELK